MCNRDPPSRKERMVSLALEIANNDKSGYSQRPPSGRWGPDFDCSSLVYFLANQAGYDVGTGSDKVRFTGTMLKDFEKAGFQILPFANVGISDLKIGDILLNLALHAEVYVGDGKTVSANSAEDGGYVGEAGDQTGHEIEVHPVATFTKGWDYVLRPPNEDEAEETEEGDSEMPTNYGNVPAQNQGWGNPQGYMQGYNNYNRGVGYPQGNLGQMNGYAQATAGGYPQSGGYQQGMMPMGPQGQTMTNDLIFVMGIEGAKNRHGNPNTREAVFDEDKPLMYIVGYDHQGNVNDIRVYRFEECAEDIPQHLSPLMQHPMAAPTAAVESLTKDDIVAIIREVMRDESASTATATQSMPRPPQPNGVQPRPSTSHNN